MAQKGFLVSTSIKEHGESSYVNKFWNSRHDKIRKPYLNIFLLLYVHSQCICSHFWWELWLSWKAPNFHIQLFLTCSRKDFHFSSAVDCLTEDLWNLKRRKLWQSLMQLQLWQLKHMAKLVFRQTLGWKLKTKFQKRSFKILY